MRRPEHFDVAVLGVGTMGSMALWRLAERGARVIGFERFEIGHGRGAAGGETRMFRTAYKEGREYVPLLQHSRRLWRQLEAATGLPLLLPTGALTIGRADHPEVTEVLASATAHGLDVEVLDIDEAAQRFPRHRLLDGEVVVLDPRGGVLDPSGAIRGAAGAASRRGAVIRTGSRVRALHDDGDGVRVDLGDDQVYADKVVVSLGPWTQALLPEIAAMFEVRRSVLHWFEVDDAAAFAPERFPVGLRRSGPGRNLSFFPCLDGRTIKVNFHIPKEGVDDPDAFHGHISGEYSQRVADGVLPLFEGLRPEPVRAAGYMEAYSLDNHGLVGPLPGRERIIALAAFSGHGFKLSPAIGDIAADFVLTGETVQPITHLQLARPYRHSGHAVAADPTVPRRT